MMKKLSLVLCCLILAAAILTCAFAADLNIEIPSLSDVLVQHRVFLSAQEENYSEYVTIFFRESDNTLVQMNDEVLFHKSSGVTKEDLEGTDLESIFPGFYSMSCASSEVVDNGDDYSLVLTFSGLDQEANLKEAIDNGILIAEVDRVITMDAVSICDDLISKGMKEIPMAEYGDIGLHFDVK